MDTKNKRPHWVWIIAAWAMYGVITNLRFTYSLQNGTATLLDGAIRPESVIFYTLAFTIPILQIIAITLLLLRISASRWFFLALLLIVIPNTLYVTYLSGLIPEHYRQASLVSASLGFGIYILVIRYTFKLLTTDYYKCSNREHQHSEIEEKNS